MPSVSSDDNKIIVDKKGVIFSKSNDFIPVIRTLDTKHDFEDYYNVKNIYSHYFSNPDIMVNKISKLKLEKSISTGANSLHPIVDFKTNVESNQDWKLTTSKNLDYTVKMPNIIGPVKITDIYEDSSLNDFYNLLPVERDVLIYLQGKKADFYENPKGINALQKLMGVTNTNNSPTFVSKDTFPFSTDKMKKIFNVAANSNFKCYTTEIMDPATESKDILKNSKSINFKLVFCYLNNEPIYINITKAENSEKISITFSRGDSNSKSSTFDMNSKIKTPSILDVVIQIYIYKNKPMKTMGAKILKALKKTGANESTKNMQDKYFNPIVNRIQELYEEKTLNMDEKEVIAIASKTIGDQMYLFDAVGYEHKNRTELNNINGTFVVSIDTFLNDYIKHTKSCNSFQASKFGKKIPRTPSNYEVCIYLKPLPEEARKKIEKEQEKANESLNNNIEKKKTEIKAGELKELSDSYNNFLQKAVTIYAKIFDEFTPVGNGRIVKEFTNKELDGGNISSTKVSEMYYTACYTLQNIIQFYYLLNATNQKYNDLIKPSTGNQNTQDLKNLYNGLNYCTAVFNDAKKFIEDMKLNEDPTMKSTLIDKLENDELVDKLKLSTPGLESVRMSLDKNALYVARLYKIKIPSTVPVKNCFTKVQKYIVGYFNQYKDLTNRKVSGGGNDKVDIKSTIEDDIKFILENGEKVDIKGTIEDDIKFILENGEDTDMIAELFDLLHYFHYRDIYEQTNTDENDNYFEDISTVILKSIKIEKIHPSHVNFVTNMKNIINKSDAYFNSQNSNISSTRNFTKKSHDGKQASKHNLRTQNTRKRGRRNDSISNDNFFYEDDYEDVYNTNRTRKNRKIMKIMNSNKPKRSQSIPNMDTIKQLNRHRAEINGKKIPLYILPHNIRIALAKSKNKTILVPTNHTKSMKTIRKNSGFGGFGHTSKKRISRSQRNTFKKSKVF